MTSHVSDTWQDMCQNACPSTHGKPYVSMLGFEVCINWGGGGGGGGIHN